MESMIAEAALKKQENIKNPPIPKSSLVSPS